MKTRSYQQYRRVETPYRAMENIQYIDIISGVRAAEMQACQNTRVRVGAPPFINDYYNQLNKPLNTYVER
jgi:hypothetical protein